MWTESKINRQKVLWLQPNKRFFYGFSKWMKSLFPFEIHFLSSFPLSNIMWKVFFGFICIKQLLKISIKWIIISLASIFNMKVKFLFKLESRSRKMINFDGTADDDVGIIDFTWICNFSVFIRERLSETFRLTTRSFLMLLKKKAIKPFLLCFSSLTVENDNGNSIRLLLLPFTQKGFFRTEIVKMWKCSI